MQIYTSGNATTATGYILTTGCRKPRGPYKKDKFDVVIRHAGGVLQDKFEATGKVNTLNKIGEFLDGISPGADFRIEIRKIL